MFIDSHTHFDMILNDKNISEDILFEEMGNSGIIHSVQVSIDVESAKWSFNFAKKHSSKGLLFTAGIHPSSRADENELGLLTEFLSKQVNSDYSNLIFGIGECGLDYYRMRQNREMQTRSFEFQIDLAKKHRLPLIVHSREAMDDTLRILKEKSLEQGIMHCFPGDRTTAKKVLDLGFYISYAGNLTYKKAVELHDSAAYVPLNRLLLETDAPFLTPVPLRGKKNRPYYITHTYNFISEIRKDPLAKIVDSVYENFCSLTNKSSTNQDIAVD